MLRFILLTAVFLALTPATRADYVLIKINMNQMTFLPPANPNPGGMAGMKGQAGGNPMGGKFGMTGGMQGDPKNPDAQPGPEDKNARWIYAYVEVNRSSPLPINYPGATFTPYDHRWGKNNIEIDSRQMPVYDRNAYIHHPTFDKEFKDRAAKVSKDKNVNSYLQLARWALSRGHLKAFHDMMKEAEKIDPQHPSVKNYQTTKKGLSRQFKDADPAQAALLKDLAGKGYKSFISTPGHYAVYAKVESGDQGAEAAIKRRLVMMEESLDTFYYWFALQEEPELQSRMPAVPRYRLATLMTMGDEDYPRGRGEFHDRHKEWGEPPITGDAFLARRENLIVMSALSRLHDPLYHEYEKLLNKKLQEANQKLQEVNANFTLTPENLLNGSLVTKEKSPLALMVIGTAQAAVLLSRSLEDEAERYTVSNATIRQLLVASGMFPRNVQVPEWTVEGLAAFFETPPGALYPTIGGPSWMHLISFKHYQKNKRFSSPAVTLQNVISDAYFVDARHMSKEVQQAKDDADTMAAQIAEKQAWELAQSTAWAYVYYLAETKQIHRLFNYGKELDKLPRDMDLNDFVLQAVYARGFDMTSKKDSRLMDGEKLSKAGTDWFKMMQEVNLEMVGIQTRYEKMRSPSKDTPKTPNPMPAIPPPSPGGSGRLEREAPILVGIAPMRPVLTSAPWQP